MARPQSTFLIVYMALLALLALTIGAAHLQLGAFKPAANLGMATIKAGLIAWFFMHVREGSGLVRLFSVAALFWLMILVGLGLSDWLTRGAP